MEWVFDFNWVKELENETACDSNFDPSSIVDPFESLASLFAFHLSAGSNSKIAWKRLPDDSAIEISMAESTGLAKLMVELVGRFSTAFSTDSASI